MSVVKVTILLADIADWPTVNGIYQECELKLITSKAKGVTHILCHAKLTNFEDSLHSPCNIFVTILTVFCNATPNLTLPPPPTPQIDIIYG